MQSVVRITRQGKVKDSRPSRRADGPPEIDEGDPKGALIQALIPVALDAGGEELQRELTRLAGPKHSHTGGLPGVVRWCRQRGSISLADQKVPRTYQRARNRLTNVEVPLRTYQQLQVPRQADAGLFPDGPLRPELPGLRSVRRSRPRRLRAQPLQCVPPLHPGEREAAPSPPGAAAGSV